MASPMTIPHLPTVTAGTVRHARGTDSIFWPWPVTLDQAREWARRTADGETIHSASFTHLDGSVSPMYVSTHGMAHQNNHRHHHHR